MGITGVGGVAKMEISGLCPRSLDSVYYELGPRNPHFSHPHTLTP